MGLRNREASLRAVQVIVDGMKKNWPYGSSTEEITRRDWDSIQAQIGSAHRSILAALDEAGYRVGDNPLAYSGTERSSEAAKDFVLGQLELAETLLKKKRGQVPNLIEIHEALKMAWTEAYLQAGR